MVQIVVLWPLLFLCLFLHLYLQDLDFIFINKGEFVDFNSKIFPISIFHVLFTGLVQILISIFFWVVEISVHQIATMCQTTTVVENLISPGYPPPPQHAPVKIALLTCTSIQLNPFSFWLLISWYITNLHKLFLRYP